MINMEQVCFSYTGMEPYIIKDLNLQVEQGEYISVIGDNGCGKTTLMRMILGFLRPMRGSITIDTQKIGYVPQKNDFMNSKFPITVYEMMDSYRRLLKIKRKEVILESLKMVGMEADEKSLMGNLSGGQTQKILIARALMGDPELLVLDEPSTGVDIDSQKEIYAMLKEMSTKQKKTILAVEHNMEAVFANSTKIYHLQNGVGHFCNKDKYMAEYLPYRMEDK